MKLPMNKAAGLALCVSGLLAAPLAAQEAEGPAPSAMPVAGATEIVVTAPRQSIPLKENPAATTVVNEDILQDMTKSINAAEALRLVPGVKVDDQADGERVHLSIRGVGILTERGVRGIKVLLDGIPLNDPSGFAPDLFDVDWAAVERVEVLRGPAAALYGGGSSGGVINIITREGAGKPTGEASLDLGSYRFWKAFAETEGQSGNFNYRVSGSRSFGEGYRDWTNYWSTNLYGKFRWKLDRQGSYITAIVAGTNYFNQNAEGLNVNWLRDDRRQANPDAAKFNEHQQTNRLTCGVTGMFVLNRNADQDITFNLYYRDTKYREAVPSFVDHRTYHTPGSSIQYNIHSGHGFFKNHFSAGVDWGKQNIDDYAHPNLGKAVEGPGLVADQNIHQRGEGYFLLDRVEIGSEWGLMFGLRYDKIKNSLDDHLYSDGIDQSGETSFNKTTGRFGVTWNPSQAFGMYASWGQGFLPPSTEELYANPDAIGGFNKDIVPATSHGEEIGARGMVGKTFVYDVALFHLSTSNDFERYRVPTRPLETFYRNAGSTKRYGLETSLGWYPVEGLALRAVYTYNNFTYRDLYSYSLGGDYSGNRLPNSPRHKAYFDTEYAFGNGWKLGLAAELQSRSYVDAKNEAWAGGYTLVHPRVAYRWKTKGTQGEVMVQARNLFGVKYIAFTEPDPDGNSYQPAPERELFIGVHIWFGK